MSQRANRSYVCEQCIDDTALQEVVRDNAISEQCDYCGRAEDEPIACELSDVIERIRYAIAQVYSDPIDEIPWDSELGGYVDDPLCISEVFEAIDFSLENEVLFEDLCAAFFDEPFCKRDYYGPTTEEEFSLAWKRFKNVVQHQRRYTFWNSVEKGDIGEPAHFVTPGNMLEEIARNIERLSPVTILPPGTELWRMRIHDRDKVLVAPHDYTSPPLDKATQPNRMSPAGIPMFYGTEDFETAYTETVEPGQADGKVATGVTFASLIPLNLLDLTATLQHSSFFVDWDRYRRHAVGFLEAFANDLSRPIERDGRQHIEYVPTQVFTEYVRYELKTPGDEPFHGIKYRSSRNRGACFVIFADQDDCLNGRPQRVRPQMLSFVDGSMRTADIGS